MWMFFFSMNEPPKEPPKPAYPSYDLLRAYLPGGQPSVSAEQAYGAALKAVLAPWADSDEFADSRFFPAAVFDASAGKFNSSFLALAGPAPSTAGFYFTLKTEADVSAARAFAQRFNRALVPAVQAALPSSAFSLLAEVTRQKGDKEGASDQVLQLRLQAAPAPGLSERLTSACVQGAKSQFRFAGNPAKYGPDPLAQVAQEMLGPAFVQQVMEMKFSGDISIDLFGASSGDAPTAGQRKSYLSEIYEPFVKQFNDRFVPGLLKQAPDCPFSVRAKLKGENLLFSFEPARPLPEWVRDTLAKNGVSVKA